MKIFKKLLAVSLAALIVTATPAAGLAGLDLGTKAYALESAGQFDNGVSWSFDRKTGKLTITGEGAIPGNNDDEGIYYNQFYEDDEIKSLVIGEGITYIAHKAFYGCKNLKEISLPDTLEYIDYGAFQGCDSLTTVILPENLTYVSGFEDCKCLKNITIREGVKEIGYGAFENCTSLTNITIPESVEEIGNWAFKNCTSLTSINIPEKIKIINKETFSGCTSLTSITIPGTVKTIGESAFENCDNLTDLTISYGVEEIGLNAFLSCDNLTKIDIPESVKHICRQAFLWCKSLDEINVPDSDIVICPDALCCTKYSFTESNWDNEALYLNNYLIEVKEGRIEGSYSIKPGTTMISCDFSDDIESITIPDSVIIISDRVFAGNKNLTSITIPSSVEFIGYEVFKDCKNLTSVTISDGVKVICGSFIGCTGLKTIVIPDSVVDLGVLAFQNCTSLESVVLSKSLTEIGMNTFYGCTSLKSITIPYGVKEISQWAFEDCTSLTEIKLPDSITKIGNGAFRGCTSLTEINLPDSITELEGPFSGCTSLTSIKIPNGITEIDSYTFSECTSLTSVAIPDSVTEIGEAAFRNCEMLSDVYYAGSESEWEDINIGWYNKDLTNATIHYNSTLPDEPDDPDDPEDPDDIKIVNGDAGVSVSFNPAAFDREVNLSVREIIQGQEDLDEGAFDVEGYEAIGIYKIYTYYTENGKNFKIQPKNGEKVTVMIPCNETEDVYIFHYVDGVSELEIIEAGKLMLGDKKYITFEVSSFSRFVATVKSDNEGEDDPIIIPSIKSVSIDDVEMKYKSSTTLNTMVIGDADYTVTYSSDNEKVAKVDANGNVYAAKKGTAKITCTVTDANGKTYSDTCTVTVKYTFGQWLIKILLFGWIWY